MLWWFNTNGQLSTTTLLSLPFFKRTGEEKKMENKSSQVEIRTESSLTNYITGKTDSV